jgi:uncharacterized membrane protein
LWRPFRSVVCFSSGHLALSAAAYLFLIFITSITFFDLLPSHSSPESNYVAIFTGEMVFVAFWFSRSYYVATEPEIRVVGDFLEIFNC